MAFDLKEKVAFVTGAATGIGLNYVKELLRNGVNGVTIADVNATNGEEAVKGLTKEFGPNKVIFVKADVTEKTQLEDAFKVAIAAWKRLDVVINNAGVMNDSQWELQISINCDAVVRGTLLALQYMSKEQGGNGRVIVNIASILGLQPLQSCPIYVGTKHFVVGFDRSLGTPYHYNRTGVKILTMCPGVTDTVLINDARKYALTTLSPTIGQQLVHDLASLPQQKTEHVALGIITLITKGASGSVWVAEGEEPIYEVAIPDRHTYRKS